MPLAAILLCVLLWPACGEAAHAAKPKGAREAFVRKSIRFLGKAIRYSVYVPPGRTRTTMPAIVYLHGSGEIGTDGVSQLSTGLANAVRLYPERWPFIIIFPQKQDRRTRWGADDGLVMAILAKTRREYLIDGSRIYLTGISLGGQGTYSIAAKHPGVFAAIAPVCGRAHLAAARKLTSTPVWAFHGAEDGIVPVSESRMMVARLRKLGCRYKFTVYPGVGHNSWNKAYAEEELPNWFLQHRANQPSDARPLL